MSLTVSLEGPTRGALCALIQDQARRAALCFSPAVARDLLQEAESFILERIWTRKLDPCQSYFPAAVQTSLFRLGIDLQRRRQRQPALLDLSQESVARAAEPEEILPAEARVERVRVLLDRIRWRPRSVTGVDLFAVLLLHLRLALGAECGRLQARSRALPLPHMADFVAWCLPWRPEEEALRFRPGLPSLRDAWSLLFTTLNTPPHRVGSGLLCRQLSGGTSEAGRLTTACWDQWVHRARQNARDRIEPADWKELFASWLPEQSFQERAS